MQTFCSDILGDSDLGVLSTKAFGAYWLLILHLWVSGGKMRHNINELQIRMHCVSREEARILWRQLRRFFVVTKEEVQSEFVNDEMQRLAAYRLSKGGDGSGGSGGGSERKPVTSNQDISISISVVLKLWDLISSKKPEKIEEAAIAKLLKNPNSAISRLNAEEIKATLANFGKARRLKHSRAWNFSLYNFLHHGFEKYVPGAFDLDNFNKDNFKQERVKDGTDKRQKAKTMGPGVQGNARKSKSTTLLV